VLDSGERAVTPSDGRQKEVRGGAFDAGSAPEMRQAGYG
jgi:hypothetical protein